MAQPDESPYEPLWTPTERSSQHQAMSYARTSDALHSNAQPGGSLQAVNNKETELGKQDSLLHQSSSYLKQATSGFMRWQSRRAFWSAVDPAEESAAAPQAASIACGNMRSYMAHWFKTVVEVSRRHPSVIIAPLLLACACIAGGLAGVIVSAQHAEQQARDHTASMALTVSASLELAVLTSAIQPAAALAAVAREQPAVAELQPALPAILSRLLQQQQQSTASAVRQVVLAPFGTVNASYSAPPSISGSAAPAGSDLFGGGASVWAVGGGAGAAAVTLAVQSKAPAVATLVSPASGAPSGAASEVLLLSYYPIYVTGVTAGETWGNTVSGDFVNQICKGGGGCYNSSSGTKLWGFAISVVSLSSLLLSPDAGLQGLAASDYLYSFSVLLTAQQNNAVSGDSRLQLAASVPPARRASPSAAIVSVRLAGPLAGALQAGAAGTEAELIVQHDEAWQLSWKAPLITVVIVVSLALSAFLFTFTFNYWRHTSMLQAMLPQKVLRVLETGSNYYQHFDCVTVLYADVVRYTAAKSQQGDTVPTLEVVKLLNDVHSMYESIINKYGLVRIRRSGESFLCVGGCPTPDDPVVVAVRVASCARDLLLATSRFRGSCGFRVQLRIGLHSGPAVAAVVGSKMPRFSLFGDVVDVAYYMEATSRVMAVHVSDRTAQLLTTANDPLLQLVPRGRMDIIGQGSMSTSWLRLDQLPNPAEAAATYGDGDDRQQAPGTASGAAAAAVEPQDLGSVGGRAGGGGAAGSGGSGGGAGTGA